MYSQVDVPVSLVERWKSSKKVIDYEMCMNVLGGASFKVCRNYALNRTATADAAKFRIENTLRDNLKDNFQVLKFFFEILLALI